MVPEYYYSLGITADELDTLQEAFQIYDTKNHGSIRNDQFSHIIASLGIVTEPKQIEKIVKGADTNGDGAIDFHEFVLTMFRYIPHEPVTSTISYNHTTQIFTEKDVSDEELMACFKYFDQDHDGRISQKELEVVMSKLNSQLTPKELKDMMHTADINRDGFIDFDEFKQLLPPL
ncbi:unnamed protein product [Mucor hiemalis]